MKTSRLFSTSFSLAVICAVGLGISVDTVTAQTSAGTRRGGSSSGGSTAGSSGSGSSGWYGVEERGYLPHELDKPIDEFFLGQTVWAQREGGFQATLGGAIDLGTEGVAMTGLLARGEYGITNNFEVHAAVPVNLSTSSTTGQSSLDPTFERIELGALYALTPMNNPIALSAVVDVDIPIASAETENVIVKPALVGAYDFGPTELHSALQAEFGAAQRGLNFDAGLAYSMGELVPVAEFNVRATEGMRPQMHLTPGLYYNFSNRTEFGVGVPVGLNDISQTGIVAKLNVHLGQ